ncbi:MAG: glycogen synthase GlgA [Candidatus Zixiibacteriota bacterium]|nr:MAG: glycogen synthase GlgA [candidate division Zixibacteria bacterium]
MKILVVSSEAVPFAKTGGLGDVVGALPKALAKKGHELKVFIPRYRNLTIQINLVRKQQLSSPVLVGGRKYPLTLEYVAEKRIPLVNYFVKNDRFFDRKDLYRDNALGEDYTDNDERFIFFTKAVLVAVGALDWTPDIIHVHDWQSALIPAYLKTTHKDDPSLAGSRTVLTIHNLAYQGAFGEETFSKTDLPPEQFFAMAPFEFYGKVNFLKGGIMHADKVTTVSRQYAKEIQTEQLGCGLNGVLTQRADDLTGILNGVDYSIWSPSRDKKIPHNYHPANLSGKRANKVELLRRFSLPIRDRAPLIGIISRLADQKGFDLFEEIADTVFAMNLQMIVLGTGDTKYHELFADLERRYPDKLRACLTFDDGLAHWIEAACDMFLMPSQFEPCGLNQMYSLKYGTVPIVREVGGLADTVDDYDPHNGTGTGFVFKEYTAQALLDCIERAIAVFSKKRVWTKIMKAGMRRDYSWDESARKYEELFQQLSNS